MLAQEVALEAEKCYNTAQLVANLRFYHIKGQSLGRCILVQYIDYASSFNGRIKY